MTNHRFPSDASTPTSTVRRLLGYASDGGVLPIDLVSAQFRAARGGYPVTFVATLIAVAAIVDAMPATARTVLAALPLVVISVFSLWRWHVDRRHRWCVTDPRRTTLYVAGLSLGISLAFGWLLSVAILSAGPLQLVVFTCTIAGVMAVGALAVAPVPLASLAYLAGSGIFTVADVILLGLPGEVGALLALFIVLLGRSILTQARMLVDHHAASASLMRAEEQRHEAERSARAAREKAALAEVEATQALREKAIEERRAEMVDLGERFQRSVVAAVSSLAGAAQTSRAAADGLAGLGSAQAQEAARVASSAARSCAATETMRTTTHDLYRSVRDVAHRATDQVTLAAEAGVATRKSTHAIATLTDGARDIGAIVTLIGDVARQTNMLALNATIEAARAGDAGRGFSVVATEVKSLADETQRATADIHARIAAMQQRVAAMAEVIATIDRSVDVVEQLSKAIHAAMEDQARVTGAIDRAAAGAYDGMALLRQGVDAAAGMSTTTRDLTVDVAASSAAIVEEVETLARAAQDFLAELRAA